MNRYKKLEIFKVSEFWSFLSYGKGDYLKIKKEIFSQETASFFYKLWELWEFNSHNIVP